MGRSTRRVLVPALAWVEDRSRLGKLEEPLSDVVFVECGDVWRLHDEASPLPEPEHALEGAEFAVDRGVRRFLSLARRHVD